MSGLRRLLRFNEWMTLRSTFAGLKNAPSWRGTCATKSTGARCCNLPALASACGAAAGDVEADWRLAEGASLIQVGPAGAYSAGASIGSFA
jgi:hypothetical protein